MAITANDIKLLASARMADTSDGGGVMTGAVVQDGVENNVFPDYSTVNRVRGALELRKVYAAVLSATTDTFLGAHVILDATPTDANVNGLLVLGASSAETVAGVVAALNAAGSTAGFRGAAKSTAALLSGNRTLTVDSTYAALIPKTVSTVSVSGAVAGVASGSGGTVVGWESSGQTVALGLSSGSGSTYLLPNTSIGGGHLKPGSVSGTFVTAGGTGSVSSDLDGNVTFSGAGWASPYVFVQSYDARGYGGAGSLPSAVSSTAIAAEVLVEVALPKSTTRTAVVAGRTTYTVSLPAAVSINTVSIQYPVLTYFGNPPVTSAGSQVVFETDGKQAIPASAQNLTLASLSRSTGVLTLVFAAGLPLGYGDIVVSYAAGGQTSALPSSALASSGAISGGGASVAIGSGLVFGGATFNISGGGEQGLRVSAGTIFNASGVTRGTVSSAGAILLPSNDGRSITGWYGVQRNPDSQVVSIDATIPTGIVATTLVISGTRAVGGAFTATPDAGGVFSTAVVTGTYVSATGALQLAFSTSVGLASLTYAATQNLPDSSTADLRGLVESAFPADGKVPIIRAGGVVVLQNFADITGVTAVAAATLNCGRTGLSAVRVIGANGLPILTGWTANLTTGVVTWGTVTGWSQPVTVRHSIDHTAVVTGVTGSTGVTLNRAVTRDFGVGSVLSSAVLLGDLQAQCGAAFSQESWTSVWSDVRIGSAVAAQYQQAANPIVVSNQGAATERWAVIFTSATTFRLVGESLGQIATGDTASAFAPVNPATGTPYFTLSQLGWGVWAAGNVLRFNTTGANAPIWMMRVTKPSASYGTVDSMTVAVRGDINA